MAGNHWESSWIGSSLRSEAFGKRTVVADACCGISASCNRKKCILYYSNKMKTADNHWYAIRTRHDSKAESLLAEECDEVFFPKEENKTSSGIIQRRAIIPHVLFIRTSHDRALELESRSRKEDGMLVPFWIYRYHKNEAIQIITEHQINLLRLLTADDTSRCEIFSKTDFRKGQPVRVTGGIFEGYRGTVQRIRKNRHVVVEIEGICLVMLPFIHPDLLEAIDDRD